MSREGGEAAEKKKIVYDLDTFIHLVNCILHHIGDFFSVSQTLKQCLSHSRHSKKCLLLLELYYKENG